MPIPSLLVTFYVHTRHSAGETRATGSSYGQILQSFEGPKISQRIQALSSSDHDLQSQAARLDFDS